MKFIIIISLIFSFLISEDKMEKTEFKTLKTDEINIKNLLTNNYDLINFDYEKKDYQKHLDILFEESFIYFHQKDYLKALVLLKHIEKYYTDIHSQKYDSLIRKLDSIHRVMTVKFNTSETEHEIYLDKKLFKKTFLDNNKNIINEIIYFDDKKGVMYNYKKPRTFQAKDTYNIHIPKNYSDNIFSISYIETENLIKELALFRKNTKITQMAYIQESNQRIPFSLNENIEVWLANSNTKYFDDNQNPVKEVLKQNNLVKQITYFENNNIKNIDFFNENGRLIKTSFFKDNKISVDVYFNNNFEIEKKDFYENDFIIKKSLYKNEILFVDSIYNISTNSYEETFYNTDGTLRNGEFERRNDKNIFIFNLKDGKKENSYNLYDLNKNFIGHFLIK